ncbi:MAG: hypothetical protein WA996_06030 [Candidatus Promineifilaceae bacterium]
MKLDATTIYHDRASLTKVTDSRKDRHVLLDYIFSITSTTDLTGT